MAKTKALISFAVTAKLICAFVFAYADCWCSHEVAHFMVVLVTCKNESNPIKNEGAIVFTMFSPIMGAICCHGNWEFSSDLLQNLMHAISETSGKHVREISTPLIPHFYIVKLGLAGVYLFFLFLLQNMDCGYSLEPPLFLTCTKNLCFEQK